MLIHLSLDDSPGVLRGIMGYIVGMPLLTLSSLLRHSNASPFAFLDLTIIMQSLFWLVQARGGNRHTRITRRLIKLAIKAYKDSGDRTRVHDTIRAWVTKTTAWKPDSKVSVYEKIVELIENNRFEPPESYKEDAKHEEGEKDHEDYWSSVEELESVELYVPDGSSGRGRSGSDSSANSASVLKHRWTDKNLMWRDAC
jgi:hypothetical protein